MSRKSLVDNKGRIFALDFLRGAAISIVIFGHALQKIHGVNPPHPLHAIILCFQMELFFAIAGYAASLLSGGSLKSEFVKRAKRLLLPYLAWVTISFIYGLFRGNANFSPESFWRYYFMHQFWFLRTMFYVSCIHLFAFWVYESSAKRERKLIGIAGATATVVLLVMFGKYVLCDVAVPRYLIWFYVGYALSFVFKLKRDVEGAEHSKLGMIFSSLGKESLALYALHWWVFFNFLPIPECPAIIQQVVYAFVIFVIWLMGSLLIDIGLSRSPLAPYLLGKSQLTFHQSRVRVDL